MTERQNVVGRCAKCGREFLTMPRDGLDHYGLREYGMTAWPICGGAVRAIDSHGELHDKKEG